MGNEYCGYCTIMWNRRDHGTSKMNHDQPRQTLIFIQRRWCCVHGRIRRELLPENQGINPNKYCSQLDQLKTPLNKKHPELVNIKCIIFYQDNGRPHVFLMTRQKLLQFEKLWIILYIHQTLHLQMSVYFDLYKIVLMEEILIPWKTVKGTWDSSLLKKIKSSGKMEL